MTEGEVGEVGWEEGGKGEEVLFAEAHNFEVRCTLRDG